jgi:23S rRNA pseudouridine1911/1915/1917 synthase
MPLDILYEDEDVLVINKSAGVIVHPARGHMHGVSLQNGVLFHCRDIIGRDGVTIGPAHRLDMATSGVILFAKRTRAYKYLAAQFSSRDAALQKEYLLLSDGESQEEAFSVTYPLVSDGGSEGRQRVALTEEGGKSAHTDFQTLERGRGWTLLKARPKTGRTHQIRVHAASAHLPILGDILYHSVPSAASEFVRENGLSRLALHAFSLSVRRPEDGRVMCFQSPIPSDMLSALAGLRSRRQ